MGEGSRKRAKRRKKGCASAEVPPPPRSGASSARVGAIGAPPPSRPGVMSRRCRLLLGCLVGRAASFGFTVPAGKSECFHESAKASERLSGEWKVLKGGMMDLDVQACRRPPLLKRSRCCSDSHATFLLHATR